MIQIDKGLFNFIIGIIIGNVIAFICFCCWQDKLYKNNYVIPKEKCLGTYIQLDNGKLYKKQ